MVKSEKSFVPEKAVEPGSAPIALAQVIAEMRQELKALRFDKDSNKELIDQDLHRLKQL